MFTNVGKHPYNIGYISIVLHIYTRFKRHILWTLARFLNLVFKVFITALM